MISVHNMWWLIWHHNWGGWFKDTFVGYWGHCLCTRTKIYERFSLLKMKEMLNKELSITIANNMLAVKEGV
jgi:hypothetical protein